MVFNNILYSVKQGIVNIWRNLMFSLASIATMAACIFMFGIFFILVTNFNSMVKEAEEGVAVTVFFNEGISQERIDEIGDQIKARAEVSDYHFVSAEEAWETLRRTTSRDMKRLRRDLQMTIPLQMQQTIRFTSMMCPCRAPFAHT